MSPPVNFGLRGNLFGISDVEGMSCTFSARYCKDGSEEPAAVEDGVRRVMGSKLAKGGCLIKKWRMLPVA